MCLRGPLSVRSRWAELQAREGAALMAKTSKNSQPKSLTYLQRPAQAPLAHPTSVRARDHNRYIEKRFCLGDAQLGHQPSKLRRQEMHRCADDQPSEMG